MKWGVINKSSKNLWNLSKKSIKTIESIYWREMSECNHSQCFQDIPDALFCEQCEKSFCRLHFHGHKCEGDHCYFPDCSLTWNKKRSHCSSCKRLYCKDHLEEENHDCGCAFPRCRKTANRIIRCNYCLNLYCDGHYKRRKHLCMIGTCRYIACHVKSPNLSYCENCEKFFCRNHRKPTDHFC